MFGSLWMDFKYVEEWTVEVAIKDGYIVITARKRSFGQGNVYTGVCLSRGGLCMMSLPVWLPIPMFLIGGLCLWSHVPCWGSSWVSVQLGLCSGSLCPRGSLSSGGLCRETLSLLPPRSEKRVVRILLECFLFLFKNDGRKSLQVKTIVCEIIHSGWWPVQGAPPPPPFFQG